MDSPSHFQGKSVPEHLKEARQKGALVSSEVHGAEMSGFFSSFTDSSKESALLLLLLVFLLAPSLLSLLLIAVAWCLWKTIRSAFLGWSRIERLHRLIEEERWEIEHHRKQEKEELTELYAAKGLTGTLLTETIDVLMADDNRLLQIMLEEELGLTLEAYEHPLKQALGAFIGSLTAMIIVLVPFALFASNGLYIAAPIWILVCAFLQTKKEKNKTLPYLIWHIGALVLLVGLLKFLHPLLHSLQ